ncbi:hypothetical protein Hanom_Chr11g01010801 [Helianthus anomalus]
MIKKTKDLARCTLSEMISHIKACELDDKQRETNYKNSMLAAGFSMAPTSSSDSNTALLSQGGASFWFIKSNCLSSHSRFSSKYWKRHYCCFCCCSHSKQ